MSVYNFQLNSVLCFETRAFGILNFGVMVVLVWHGGGCQKKCISITIFSYLRHYSILKQCLCECLFVVHIVTWTKTKLINKLLRVHNTDWKSSLNVNFFKNQLCNWSGSKNAHMNGLISFERTVGQTSETIPQALKQ